MILSSHGIIASQIASFDADAVAFFNRVTTAGGTLSTTEKQAVNQLVLDLKANSLWTPMKAIYPMVGASAAACAQNLKSSSFTGTFSSGWTFASTGVTPNGTSAYFDTGLVPSSVLGYNNNHMSYYSRTSIGQSGDVRDMGASGSNVSDDNLILIVRYPANSQQYYVVDDPYNYSYSVGASSAYYAIGTSTDNTVRQFKNTTKLGTYTKTGSLLPSVSAFIGATNTNGTATRFNNLESSFASIGDGLTDTQASNFYTAVQAFQTTLSRNV